MSCPVGTISITELKPSCFNADTIAAASSSLVPRSPRFTRPAR